MNRPARLPLPPARRAGGVNGHPAQSTPCAAIPASAGLQRLRRVVPASRDVALRDGKVHYQGVEEPVQGFLRRRRVGPAGRSKYLKAAADFREFCATQRLSLASSPEVDDALDQYQVHLFAGEKSRLRVAREAFYGVRYAFDLHNFHLPLSKASLEGFRKEDPDASREPCPWEALVLAVLPIMEMGTAESVLASAALLLNFDAYARPGALCQLRGSSLLRAGSNRWCLIFFPGDQLDTSKTGTQDDTVEIGVGRRAWLRGVCSSLHSRRGRAGSLFGLSLPKLQKYFTSGLKAAGLEFLSYTPHCLRHGGASTDAADGVEAMAVQLRGQWKDARSVTRYMKKGALLRQQARLGRVRKRAAEDAERSLRRRLASEIVRRVPVHSSIPSVPVARISSQSVVHDIKDKRRPGGPIAWRPMKQSHRC